MREVVDVGVGVGRCCVFCLLGHWRIAGMEREPKVAKSLKAVVMRLHKRAPGDRGDWRLFAPAQLLGFVLQQRASFSGPAPTSAQILVQGRGVPCDSMQVMTV